MFRLKLFGGATIEGPAGPLTGRAAQRRRLALLALLAIARGRGLTRDKLVAYLWPDSDAERARHLLSDSIYRINQAVGGEALVAAGDELRLNPDRLPCDAWEFAEAMEREEWQRAVELQSAPFLDGFFLTGAEEFERWVDVERDRHARERARALESLAQAAEAAGDLNAAVRWWRMLAAVDPYSSRVSLRLMRALEQAGDRAAAVQHARVHSLLVREELGIEPDPEVLRCAERLKAGEPAAPERRDATQPEVAPAGAEPGIAPAGVQPPESGGAIDGTEIERRPSAPPSAASHVPKRARTRHVALASGALLIAFVFGMAWLTRTLPREATGERTSIAVLPFTDISPARDHEYFADGITEELLVKLSKVSGLRVVGRTSAFAFKGRSVDVREIAERLGVSVVLEGSVKRVDDRLRIFAQLVDGTNGYQLWSETYEREMAGVFAI